MSRYDKMEPKHGSYRAPLAEDYPPELVERVVGVGHDEDGRVVVGGGNTGITGVLVLTKAYKAGHVIDVMTGGEIVEFGYSVNEKADEFETAPGTVYGVGADGVVAAGEGAGGRVGHTVRGQRLIVRFRPA